jgi:hypothetical protein
MPEFFCSGLDLEQPSDGPPEGLVACYLAGHRCESATETTGDDYGMETRVFCRCCGDLKGAMGRPWSMEDQPRSGASE